MSRGLPWSVVLHVAVLVLVALYGNRVQRQVVEPPRTLNFRMVRPEPEMRPAESPPEDPAPQPAVRAPEPEPVLPPKQVPEEPTVKPPEPEPDPEPVRRPEPPAPDPTPADETEPAATPAEATPTLSGPSVAGTDTNFPFAWYLSQIEAKIARNWKPRQLGFAERSHVSCAVHFVIARNGSVSQVTLVRNSGVGVYDREALRAVQTARLMPLPPQYGAATLGVTFTFNLEPRS
jgi:TonB family protein